MSKCLNWLKGASIKVSKNIFTTSLSMVYTVNMRILLIEEDVRLSQEIAEIFQKKFYGIDAVYNGAEGFKFLQNGIYDVVILDTTLPDIEGINLLKTMREEGNPVPVLLLSDKTETADKVLGLDSGADDYVTKPFVAEEFVARVRALSRRKGALREDSITVGDLCFNKTNCELQKVGGGIVKISRKECEILEILFENPRQIIKKERIIEKIWGSDSDTEYNNVEVYISFIRKKLETLGVNVYIRTARGIGYSLEEAH